MSPWMLAAYAQSLAARGPMYPAPFVVQGVTIEMLADGRLERERQAGGVYAGAQPARPPRAATARPDDGRNEPALVPLLPVIQRL